MKRAIHTLGMHYILRDLGEFPLCSCLVQGRAESKVLVPEGAQKFGKDQTETS